MDQPRPPFLLTYDPAVPILCIDPKPILANEHKEVRIKTVLCQVTLVTNQQENSSLPPQPILCFSFLNIYIYLFVWLCRDLVAAQGIFVATCRIFSCGMWDLQLQHVGSQLWHVGSSSLTRDETWAPCIGSVESQPLDHQRSSPQPVLNNGIVYCN